MHPDFDFLSLFVEGLSGAEIFVAIIGFVAAASFAGLWATKFGYLVLPHPSESRVSDFLPFEKLLSDGATIRCYNGSLARFFKISGVDLAFSQSEKGLSPLRSDLSSIAS